MSKKTTLALLAAAVTLAPPTAVRAQVGGGFGGGSGGGFSSNGGGFDAPASAKPAWMSKKVTLHCKSFTVQGVLKMVLNAVGISSYSIALGDRTYDIENGTVFVRSGGLALESPYGNPVTADIIDVPAETVLKQTAKSAGVEFAFRTEDNRLKVTVTKTAAGYGTIYKIGPNSSVDPAIASALAQAAKTAQDVQTYYAAPLTLTMPGNSALPDTRVGLDVRDGDVRDTLKTVLKQANLAYALEDDLPTATEKHSFTFENVPIGTALDVICQSIGVGWRVETVGGKPLVRVGKKYVAKAGSNPDWPIYQRFYNAAPASPIFTKPAR